jgi:hypothetical protein
MKFAISTVLLALLASASATVVTPRAGANGNRPVASGNCCIANTSLKQDACNSPGGAGRCVPGGGAGNCGGALNCVAQSDLGCDAAIIERGKSLCRAKVAGGFQDGTKVIKNLSQAKVN